MNIELLPKLIGIPYLSGGRNPAVGLDCWGIVRTASKELFDHEVPDYSGYVDSTDPDQTLHLFENRRAWQVITPGQEQPGDVVILRVIGYPVHAGLMLERGCFIHSIRGRNSCLERYTPGSHWERRIEGFYRWPTV